MLISISVNRSWRLSQISAFLILLGVASACSHAPMSERGFVERGIASWYGKGFKGKLTANGERYNPKQFTAAHRTLPFGTKVLVKDLETGKTVLVRINDRGPAIKSRIIDLSYAAAAVLGIVKQGTCSVEIRADDE